MAKSVNTFTTTTAAASTSSIFARTAVANTRITVETFDDTCYFGMWQGEVLDTLFQQSLDIAIEREKSEEVDEKEWKTINRLACGTMQALAANLYHLTEQATGYLYSFWKFRFFVLQILNSSPNKAIGMKTESLVLIENGSAGTNCFIGMETCWLMLTHKSQLKATDYQEMRFTEELNSM